MTDVKESADHQAAMSGDSERNLQLLYSELEHTRTALESRLDSAWKVLLISLTVPVSAATLQLENAEFLEGRVVFLVASLLGMAFLAYSLYLYQEVMMFAGYASHLERRINRLAGIPIAIWETVARRARNWGIPAIFLTFIVAIVTCCVFAVVHACSTLLQKTVPLVPCEAVVAISMAMVALFAVVVWFIRGVYSNKARTEKECDGFVKSVGRAASE